MVVSLRVGSPCFLETVAHFVEIENSRILVCGMGAILSMLFAKRSWRLLLLISCQLVEVYEVAANNLQPGTNFSVFDLYDVVGVFEESSQSYG